MLSQLSSITGRCVMGFYLGKRRCASVILLKERKKGRFRARVIDYTGKILKEEWLRSGDEFILPMPKKEGMTFQGWSTTEEIVNNKITIQNHDVIVGAVYVPESGLNEFDIEITKSMVADIETNGLTINFYMTGTKDWGDGSVEDDLQTHTYYSYGKFTIKCNGRPSLPESTGILGQTASTRDELLIEARLATWTSIASFTFTYTNSLKAVSVQEGCTYISGTACSQAYALRCFIFPNSATAVYGYIFNSNTSLSDIILSSSINTIDFGAFYACQGVQKIRVPKGLVSIGGAAFSTCRNLEVADFSLLESVPVLNGTSLVSGCLKRLKIIVPDGLYDKFISATNWSAYKNYIYKASEVGAW